jgi:hypothetical protein
MREPTWLPIFYVILNKHKVIITKRKHLCNNSFFLKKNNNNKIVKIAKFS